MSSKTPKRRPELRFYVCDIACVSVCARKQDRERKQNRERGFPILFCGSLHYESTALRLGAIVHNMLLAAYVCVRECMWFFFLLRAKLQHTLRLKSETEKKRGGCVGNERQ